MLITQNTVQALRPDALRPAAQLQGQRAAEDESQGAEFAGGPAEGRTL